MQGHIDGTSTLLAVTPAESWRVLRFSLDPEHAPLVVRKGSIAVNGVSLTVSDAGDDWFEVSLIPETLTATVLGALSPGDRVNIETDILARHIQRLASFAGAPSGAVGAFAAGSAGIYGHGGSADSAANGEHA